MKAELINDNTMGLTAECDKDSAFLERIGGSRVLAPTGTLRFDGDTLRTTRVEYSIDDWVEADHKEV